MEMKTPLRQRSQLQIIRLFKNCEVFKQIQTTLDQITSQKLTLKNLKHKLLNEILG